MISIIIPVLNAHEMTKECINSIRLCTQDYELVIVDNGSEPPIEKPYTGFVDCRVIRNEENKGFPVAVNQGIREANGDIIILLNNDTIVTPGWADRLLMWLDEYDIIGPTTNYCAGMQKVTIPTYENIDELNKEASFLAEERNGESIDANFIIGFCMMFRKSLYDELGEFDESIWPSSGEEIDFCFRAREAGYTVGIALDVYIHHFGTQTFFEMENLGILNYSEVTEQCNKHLAEKWGHGFWRKQSAVSSNGVRLNMGSGPFPLPGFINIDQFEHVKPDIVADVTAVPFENETVSEIYAGHILEHFKFDEGRKVLRYWYSLLCPGGTISITVPDFDHLARKYLSNPSPERLIEFNDLYIYSGVQPSPHQYAYSAALLKKVMEDAGFINLTVMPMNHPYFPHVVDWQIGYTGIKP